MKGKLTRREMLRLSTVVGAGTLIAACGGAATTAPTTAPKAEATKAPEATMAPEATKAPAATTAPEPTKAPEATAVPATTEIGRKQTLMLNHGGSGGKYTWVGQINPFSGVTHQEGGALLWDPLFYYSVFADKEMQERYIKASDLDWTIVRPVGLTDDPASGEYRISLEGSLLPKATRISRADVAAALRPTRSPHTPRCRFSSACLERAPVKKR